MTDYAWGHVLVGLAEKLSQMRPEFDLSSKMLVAGCAVIEMPIAVRDAFARFDPFFFELRYPGELEKLDSLGEEERFLLDALVAKLAAVFEHHSIAGQTHESKRENSIKVNLRDRRERQKASRRRDAPV